MYGPELTCQKPLGNLCTAPRCRNRSCKGSGGHPADTQKDLQSQIFFFFFFSFYFHTKDASCSVHLLRQTIFMKDLQSQNSFYLFIFTFILKMRAFQFSYLGNSFPYEIKKLSEEQKKTKSLHFNGKWR